MRPMACVIVVVGALAPMVVGAAARPAGYLAAGTGATIGYRRDQSTAVGSGQVEGVFTTVSAAVARDRWAAALGHEYHAFDVAVPDEFEPISNGDHHTLHLMGALTRDVGRGQLTLTAAPAVSASSNLFRNTRLSRDTLQLWLGSIYARELGTPTSGIELLLGGAYDHRFGEASVYPVLGLLGRYGTLDWRLTFPDIALRWQRSSWRLSASLNPDGNEWWVASADFAEAAPFVRKAWLTELELGYGLLRALEVSIFTGYSFDESWSYRTADRTVSQEVDPQWHFGMRLSWRPAGVAAQDRSGADVRVH